MSKHMKLVKVPADVVERAKRVAPLMDTTIGEILAKGAREVLPGIEQAAIARFSATTVNETRGGSK